ncbi:carbamoyltransferase N-terminal domain-containing protein [Streptomyces peucetius]|uniref:carbamoyltransferase N-terminal domain-containing protein n=1 Tax=Streptomyces peucetius TaxID=1950 RepID=UPI0039AEA5E7
MQQAYRRMCALVHRGPPLLQWGTQALRRLLWQGSWRGNTGRRSGTTGTSRIGPYRRPLLPLCFHPSACLVIDGKVVAFAEEERFSRRKHHKDSRSCAVAAAYCLSEAGITLADVDEITIAFNPAWPTPSNICTDAELIAELLAPALFGHHRPRQVTVVEHHLAHAASAFHPSGFDEAAVLVVDGSGDGVSATLAHGTADGLKVLRQFPFSQSLG